MHNILYRVYPESTPREKIIREVLEIVRSNGDGYGTSNVSFVGAKIYGSREDAEAAIDRLDGVTNGFYSGVAMRFYDFSKVAATARIKELEAKRTELENARHEYIAEHSPQAFKAEYIGCKRCGSKLSREYLKGNFCPVCHADLRSPSTLDRIRKYDESIKATDEKIKAEQMKAKEKAKVYWLVKFEYHS